MFYQNIAIINNAIQKTWEEEYLQILNHPDWSSIFQTLHISIATHKTQLTVWQQSLAHILPNTNNTHKIK